MDGGDPPQAQNAPLSISRGAEREQRVRRGCVRRWGSRG